MLKRICVCVFMSLFISGIAYGLECNGFELYSKGSAKYDKKIPGSEKCFLREIGPVDQKGWRFELICTDLDDNTITRPFGAIQ